MKTVMKNYTNVQATACEQWHTGLRLARQDNGQVTGSGRVAGPGEVMGIGDALTMGRGAGP